MELDGLGLRCEFEECAACGLWAFFARNKESNARHRTDRKPVYTVYPNNSLLRRHAGSQRKSNVPWTRRGDLRPGNGPSRGAGERTSMTGTIAPIGVAAQACRPDLTVFVAPRQRYRAVH